MVVFDGYRLVLLMVSLSCACCDKCAYMVLTIGDGPAIRKGMDPAPIPSLSARPSRPRLSDRRRENPLRTLRNATTARYTDASDASEDVSARVVCASVCVCF